ncbi:MAG TPA: hypothetical protein VI942_06950 [Thermoanaerobaculia bacterium]|nr:hypothetical protein [Thermoanaerobaculia bacterium]
MSGAATLERAFECSGEIALGGLEPASRARLAAFSGDWLEYSAEEGRIVVRHVQPGGAPALPAVPAELISILDALTPQERVRVPGGTLLVRDRESVLLRLVVAGGEIRVQWPHEDWEHAEPVGLERVFLGVDPVSARLSGTVAFEAGPGAEGRLLAQVEGFEGLYPEGDLRVERDGRELRVELRDVNVGPEALLDRLAELADPIESLEGRLEVGSFAAHAVERDFRIRIERGRPRAFRPALWHPR